MGSRGMGLVRVGAAGAVNTSPLMLTEKDNQLLGASNEWCGMASRLSKGVGTLH